MIPASKDMARKGSVRIALVMKAQMMRKPGAQESVRLKHAWRQTVVALMSQVPGTPAVSEDYATVPPLPVGPVANHSNPPLAEG